MIARASATRASATATRILLPLWAWTALMNAWSALMAAMLLFSLTSWRAYEATQRNGAVVSPFGKSTHGRPEAALD